MTAYHRVLLKLSGEVFGGGKVGVDPDVVHRIAGEIAEVARDGRRRSSVVVGGGNFFRGAADAAARHGPAPAPTTWACSAR